MCFFFYTKHKYLSEVAEPAIELLQEIVTSGRKIGFCLLLRQELGSITAAEKKRHTQLTNGAAAALAVYFPLPTLFFSVHL